MAISEYDEVRELPSMDYARIGRAAWSSALRARYLGSSQFVPTNPALVHKVVAYMRSKGVVCSVEEGMNDDLSEWARIRIAPLVILKFTFPLSRSMQEGTMVGGPLNGFRMSSKYGMYPKLFERIRFRSENGEPLPCRESDLSREFSLVEINTYSYMRLGDGRLHFL